MEKSSGFRTGRHVIFNLNAHLVFIPKYRRCRKRSAPTLLRYAQLQRGVITPRVFKVLQETWVAVCEDFESTLVESNYEPDHVHLLVKYPPKVSLSVLVNSLKGVSARKIRQANSEVAQSATGSERFASDRFEEVSKALWGKHFWSPSF